MSESDSVWPRRLDFERASDAERHPTGRGRGSPRGGGGGAAGRAESPHAMGWNPQRLRALMRKMAHYTEAPNGLLTLDFTACFQARC